MRAEKEDAYYHIFLKEENIKRIYNKEPTPFGLAHYLYSYVKFADK